MIETLEKLLAGGRDDALLRFSLGNEYLKSEQFNKAADQYAHAVKHNPEYSAAWKQLGKALSEDNRPDEAAVAWQQGIDVAETTGDKQAAREMAVFLKRLTK